jgi:hypothetical protein
VLAALRDGVGEGVELGQHRIEPQAQEAEPPLRQCRIGMAPCRSAEPGDKGIDLLAQPATADIQKPIYTQLRGRRNGRRRHHRFVQHERLHQRQARQQRPRLLFEDPRR